jgi:3-dehydroquinate synthase class II
MAKAVKTAEASQSSGNDQESQAQGRPGVAGASKGDRQWWFDARGVAAGDSSVLDAAYQSGCAALVIKPDQHEHVMTGKPRIVWVERVDQLDKLPPDLWVLTPDDGIVAKARQAGRKAGLFLEIEDLDKEFPRCRQAVKRGYDFVVIDMHHATYIPFELLIAEAEGTPTRILRLVPIKGLQGTVDEVNQALNAFGTLESGIDVLYRSTNVKDIKQLDKEIEEILRGRMELVPAEVIEVHHTGLGHRVCVDTTTLMTAKEGMIIGSTGYGGIFVCSETHYLPHMNLREFRCNAGGVMSYVWGPSNIAIYLSECKAGTRLLAVDTDGHTRVVTVGRAKIERRPLLLIVCRVLRKDIPASHLQHLGAKAEDFPEEVLIKTFLQNDWHVRIMGADKKVRNSTLVRPGDKLLAYVDKPGRHTGIEVPESIVEK